jgi:colanic acid biosynthesis glycosyl transferase WcaI
MTDEQPRQTPACCRRIVIWSPNYAPDPTGIPPLVTDSAEWLASQGHDVRVVTTFPHYPQRRIDRRYRGRLWSSESLNGVRIDRSWVYVRPRETFRHKMLYELTASGLALRAALPAILRADVLVCVVPTLTAAFYAALAHAARPRFRLVLWLQDLVLRAAEAVDGTTRIPRRVMHVAGLAERSAVRQADAIIVCSPGFHEYLRKRGVPDPKIETILNWADTERIRPTAPAERAGARFLYAGNVGYTQGLETAVEAAALAPNDTVVEIVGDGNAFMHVMGMAKGVANVIVRPPVSGDAYPALLSSADVQLVVQKRVAAGANFPSKIASYLASGRPILASIDLATPAADVLRRSEAAVLVEPESPPLLADAMKRLAGDPLLRAELGSRARDFAVKEFSREPALRRFEGVLLGDPPQETGACVGSAHA